MPRSKPRRTFRVTRKQSAVLLTVLLLFAVFAWAYSAFSTSDTYSYELIPVAQEAKWGYINHDGEFVIPPQFESADYFTGDLALVSVKRHPEGPGWEWLPDSTVLTYYGWIDRDGEFELQPKYIAATIFSEGLAIVATDTSPPTIINESGEIVAVLENCQSALPFRNGFAPVGPGFWGFIDSKGEQVIDARFSSVGFFEAGAAPAGILGYEGSVESAGLINEEGEWVYERADFYGDAKHFSGNHFVIAPSHLVNNLEIIDAEGNAVAERKGYGTPFAKQNSESKWGLYRNGGEEVLIEPKYAAFGSWTSDAKVIPVGVKGVDNDLKWGVVDLSGQEMIPPRAESKYDRAPISFGAVVLFPADSQQWGLVNSEGKFLSGERFDDIRQLPDGYIHENFEYEYVGIPQFRPEGAYFDYFDIKKEVGTIEDVLSRYDRKTLAELDLSSGEYNHFYSLMELWDQGARRIIPVYAHGYPNVALHFDRNIGYHQKKYEWYNDWYFGRRKRYAGTEWVLNNSARVNRIVIENEIGLKPRPVQLEFASSAVEAVAGHYGLNELHADSRTWVYISDDDAVMATVTASEGASMSVEINVGFDEQANRKVRSGYARKE